MRLLLTRRWLGYLALTVVFALVCVGLGTWQLARRAEAAAQIALVEDNWSAPPLSARDALGEPGGPGTLDPALEWHPVELVGTYLIDEQLLARGRPFGGQPGFAVLVPLELTDGRVFIVDRGWVPVGNDQDSPDFIPAPPEGEVTVTVRLRPGEPALLGRSAPAGQVASIELPLIAQLLGGEVYTGAYGLLAGEEPAPQQRPVAAQRPVPDEGPHLSYAFQWFLFALLGFVGLGFALRQEARGPDAPARPRRPSDAEIEDELLDRSG